MDLKGDPCYQHFAAIPWCATLLSSPSIQYKPVLSRIPKPDSREDSLFAETLKTEKTVKAALCVYQSPDPPKTKSEGNEVLDLDWVPARIKEVCLLLSLGDGLNGQPGLAHGGMIATLLDEAMAILIAVNQDPERSRLAADIGLDGGPGTKGKVVTAGLNVRFLKPLDTPITVLVRTRLNGVEGRKLKIGGSVEGEGGAVFATAESVWVQMRGGGQTL